MKILVWMIFGTAFNLPFSDVMYDTQERCTAAAKRVGPTFYCDMVVKIVPVVGVLK